MKTALQLIGLLALCGCVGRQPTAHVQKASAPTAAPLISALNASLVIPPPLFRHSVTWESWNDITSFPAECDIETTPDLSGAWSLQARVIQTNYESAVMTYAWDSTNANEYIRVGTHWKLN